MSKLKVLVATDGSGEATRACELLTRMVGDAPIDVRVLTVLSFTLYPSSLVPGEEMPDTAARARAVEESVSESTTDARTVLERAGMTVSVCHRFGNAADEILNEAREWPADVIVVGRRGLRGVERVLGSVSERVIHRAGTPVLVVG